ncbi:hypothetical protein LCGC14_2410760, partial [marine sediment metagenome]
MPVRHPMSRGELDTDLTIKGAWTFDADITFKDDVNIIFGDSADFKIDWAAAGAFV